MCKVDAAGIIAHGDGQYHTTRRLQETTHGERTIVKLNHCSPRLTYLVRYMARFGTQIVLAMHYFNFPYAYYNTYYTIPSFHGTLHDVQHTLKLQ